jgi:nitrous oxidase accessory protein
VASARHPHADGQPAIQTLRLIAQQFPLLRAPSVVDDQPHMHPLHQGWEQWLGKSND